MKIAYSKTTNDHEDTHALICMAREAGYDGLQLKAAQYRDYLDRPHEFIKHFDAAAFICAVITSLRLENLPLDSLKRELEFLNVCKGEMLVLMINACEYTESMRYRVLEKLESLISGYAPGITISLHNHIGSFIEKIEHMQWLVRNITPNIRLTFDTALMYRTGEDIVQGLNVSSKIINNVHLKDMSKGIFCNLGKGELDFAKIACAINENRIEGWITVDDETGPLTSELVMENKRFIRKIGL